MSDVVRSVRQHYAPDQGEKDLVAQISRAIGQMPPGPVSPSRLAALDQFHVGGLAATIKLADLAKVEAGMIVLDAGSGLGGPARSLAERFGCRVVGVDLTPSFVAASRLLTKRVGLDHLIDCDVGDLLALRFPDAHFDLVWTQHVAMNIRDRLGLYRELRRVLKPAARLAFHDVLAADGAGALHFPVPWAETPETSVLLTEAQTITVLETAGLKPVVLEDVTTEALAFLSNQPGPPTGFGLAQVMGPRFADMSANFARNLREGSIRLVMGVCEQVDLPSSQGRS